MANREIDDVYKRIGGKDSYKNRRFGDKKSIIDDYTGERIFYGNAQDAKYKHDLHKTADIDHVIPVSKVSKSYGDLTIEQQKQLANNEAYNYAITNSHLNRNARSGKNALDNHEYLEKKCKDLVNNIKDKNFDNIQKEIDELTKQAPRMLTKEVKARVGMAVEGNGMRIQNFFKGHSKKMPDIIENPLSERVDSLIPLTSQAVSKMCQVASGEKTIKEAMGDLSKSSVNLFVNEQLKNGIDPKLIKINGLNETQVIEVAAVVAGSAMRYLSGEISGQEFIAEVGKNGTMMVAKVVGGAVGASIGSAFGPVGTKIGQVVGSFVTSVACSMIYTAVSSFKGLSKSINDYQLKEAEIRKISNEALAEIDRSQKKLQELIDKRNKEWTRTIEIGFYNIRQGLLNDSFDTVSGGLGTIANLFGGDVIYKTESDLDSVLDHTPLVIKGRGGLIL